MTDASGNTATATQTVTVNDEELPLITAPEAVTVTADAGACTASGVVLGVPVTTDNCSVADVTNDAPASFSIGTTTVTWTVTDASGNTATATQTITVNDEELPVITAPAALSLDADAGICTASGVELGTPVTSDNCSVLSVENDAPSLFNAGETTVTWTVTDASGNIATATQTVTVTALVEPLVSILGESEVCEGTLVTFTASAQGVGNAPVYQWKLNGNDVGENAVTYLVDTLVSSDVVSCVLTTDLSCASSPEANSNEITMEVKASPVVSVTSVPAVLLVCAGSPVTLTATGADSYTWTDGIVNGQSFIPASSGEYSVTGSNANGCSHIVKVEVETQNCTDVSNAVNGNRNVIIYPNPSNGAFEILFNSAVEREIIVMDLQGKIWYQTQWYGAKASVELKGIAKGIYVVSTGEGSDTTIQLVSVE